MLFIFSSSLFSVFQFFLHFSFVFVFESQFYRFCSKTANLEAMHLDYSMSRGHLNKKRLTKYAFNISPINNNFKIDETRKSKIDKLMWLVVSIPYFVSFWSSVTVLMRFNVITVVDVKVDVDVEILMVRLIIDIHTTASFLNCWLYPSTLDLNPVRVQLSSTLF